MCGTALDAAAAGDSSSDESKPSGRVRQKTMTAPATEFADQLEKIREESGTHPQPTPQKGAPDADPLRGFLEEVEGAEEPSNGSSSVEAKEEIVDASEEMDDEPIAEQAPPMVMKTSEPERPKTQIASEQAPRQEPKPEQRHESKPEMKS